ncbi:uncharacterized protein TrAtP1_004010 [Trichoderma atroviride]|uniref:uncharacterized protein n=1 Tax=Hypocrea atroviridis TaxID=63577 RepID=UPI00332318F0|nr:hypothetical protein TrAtP1_004010 [Trichoderma atroviride]
MIVKHFRTVTTKGKDDVAIRLENLSQMKYLGMAIDNYKPNLAYIPTDVPYRWNPQATQQPQPTDAQKSRRNKKKAELEKLKKKLQDRAKQERLQAGLPYEQNKRP